jgi:integrase
VPRVVVDGYAQVSEPKTERGYRTLALDPLTIAALKTHLRSWRRERRAMGQPLEGLLFCWEDGSHVHPQTITDRFFRLSQSAALPFIRIHDLRHSYAIAALRAGIHPKIISERLGHASVAFTLQTYSHVIGGMDEAAAAQIAGHIFGPPQGFAVSPLMKPDKGAQPFDEDEQDGDLPS